MARAFLFLLPVAVFAAQTAHAQYYRGYSPNGYSPGAYAPSYAPNSATGAYVPVPRTYVPPRNAPNSAPAEMQSESQGPIERAGRVSAVEGQILLRVDGDTVGSEVQNNFPITTGAELRTSGDSMAELELGGAVVAFDGHTTVKIEALDDEKVVLQLESGAIDVRVHDLPADVQFIIKTPDYSANVLQSGSYRADIEGSDATRFAVFDGQARVQATAGWHTFNADQAVAFEDGRAVAAHPQITELEKWLANREYRLETSVSARYVSTDIPGYEELDSAGTWQTTREYGPVWVPNDVAFDWAPYQNGRWSWVKPWGWTWVDSQSWGFAPSHYGRWVFLDDHWAWSPGKRLRAPVYMPAAVGFDGEEPSRFASQGQPPARWVPLAPGEIYRAPYTQDLAYLRKVNAGVVAADVLARARWQNDEWPSFANTDHVRMASPNAPRNSVSRADETRRPYADLVPDSYTPRASARTRDYGAPPEESAPHLPPPTAAYPATQYVERLPAGAVDDGIDSQGRMVLRVPMDQARRQSPSAGEETPSAYARLENPRQPVRGNIGDGDAAPAARSPDHLTHPELADRSHLVDPLPADGVLPRAPIKQEALASAGGPTEPPLARPVHSQPASPPAKKSVSKPQANAKPPAMTSSDDSPTPLPADTTARK